MNEKKVARQWFWVVAVVAVYALLVAINSDPWWIKAVFAPIALFAAWLAWVFALYAWGRDE